MLQTTIFQKRGNISINRDGRHFLTRLPAGRRPFLARSARLRPHPSGGSPVCPRFARTPHPSDGSPVSWLISGGSRSSTNARMPKGHPLKGPCQEKTPLHCKKNSFFTGTQRRIQPQLAKYPFVCALFFNWFWLRSVFDLHQAPIRIKAVIKTVRVAQWRALKWLGTEQPFPF